MIRPTSTIANRHRNQLLRAELRKRVAHKLKTTGPQTREALEIILGINGNTIRPVVLECIKAGTVRRLKARGKTRAGNDAELLGAVR